MSAWDLRTPDDLARFLGMKTGEVVDVVCSTDGWHVRTHDGQWVHVAEDGTVTPSDSPAEPVVDEQPETEDPEAVPDGSAEVVTTWVGTDPDRAARALAAEQAKDRPRSTLVAALEKLKG